MKLRAPVFARSEDVDPRASGLDAESMMAQQRYLEGTDKDEGWWESLDAQLERLSRAAMRARVESL